MLCVAMLDVVRFGYNYFGSVWVQLKLIRCGATLCGGVESVVALHTRSKQRHMLILPC